MPYKDLEKKRESDKRYYEANREKRIAYISEYQRQHKRTPEKNREYRLRYYERYPGRAAEQNRNRMREFRQHYPERVAAQNKRYRAYQNSWLKQHKDVAIAHALVHYAVKTGKLKRPDTCQQCGLPALGSRVIEAHHHKGYDRTHRLDVMWLCTSCHVALEGKRRGMAAARP